MQLTASQGVHFIEQNWFNQTLYTIIMTSIYQQKIYLALTVSTSAVSLQKLHRRLAVAIHY